MSSVLTHVLCELQMAHVQLWSWSSSTPATNTEQSGHGEAFALHSKRYSEPPLSSELRSATFHPIRPPKKLLHALEKLP